jgi:hypothetical protein
MVLGFFEKAFVSHVKRRISRPRLIRPTRRGPRSPLQAGSGRGGAWVSLPFSEARRTVHRMHHRSSIGLGAPPNDDVPHVTSSSLSGARRTPRPQRLHSGTEGGECQRKSGAAGGRRQAARRAEQRWHGARRRASRSLATRIRALVCFRRPAATLRRPGSRPGRSLRPGAAASPPVRAGAQSPKRLERGKPLGGMRPAPARLPRQGASSVSRRVRSPERQVRPSLRVKTLASERPPSL